MALGMQAKDQLQAPHLPTAQFVTLVRAAAALASLLGGVDIVFALARGDRPWLALGTLMLGIAVACSIAGQLARRGRLAAGVYTACLGTALLAALLPTIATGLLPAVLGIGLANTLMIPLFLSPRLIRRIAPAIGLVIAISAAFDVWAPWPRVNLAAHLPIVSLFASLLGFGFAVLFLDLLSRRLASAADQAQAYADQLEQNQVILLERTADLEKLAASLRQRGQELEQLNQNWQITSQQAQRRAAQLAASAQVARAIGQVRDLDQVLTQVTQLIGDTFGYYHVGVFIVDENRRFAVLRAANSEGGQRMLARGHKLAVGTQGIVGYVTGTGQSRIALDVGADAAHFDNPDLPQTRSEMAVPLRVGDQVFGALDVQSTQEAAFTQEDVAVLETLADQIAVAIENARLFEQTRAALQEAAEIQQRYLRREWQQILPALRATSHEYRVSGVPPVGDAPLPEIEQAIRLGAPVTARGAPTPARAALAVPIKLGDQTLGVIDLHEVDADREWADQDVAFVTSVADQVALALENARLFEQAQQRARREQLIAQITTRVRAAPGIEGVLQTALREMRRALGVSHAAVRLGMETERGDTHEG